MSDPITREQVETLRRIHDSLKAERDAEQAQLEWQATRGTKTMQRIIAKLTAEVDALAAALRVLEKVGKMPADAMVHEHTSYGEHTMTIRKYCWYCGGRAPEFGTVGHAPDCLEPDRAVLAEIWGGKR